MQIELSQETLDFEEFSEFVRFLSIVISFLIVEADFRSKKTLAAVAVRDPKFCHKRLSRP